MGLILCAWLLVPALAAADPAAPAQDRPPTQRTQMSEDIEVLRRLLDSKLQAHYPPAKQLAEAWRWTNCASCHSKAPQYFDPIGTSLPNQPYSSSALLQSHPLIYSDDATWSLPHSLWHDSFANRAFWVFRGSDNTFNLSTSPHWLLPDGSSLMPHRLLDTEGVYLKGQGVVYTLTLPPAQPKAKADAAKTPPKPVSDWDRVRGELRNEKAEAGHKDRPHKEPTLAEVLLQVLAENGHHFGQLGENESLTVVVTFRGGDQAQARAASRPASDPESAAQKPADPATSRTPGQDYELLGDLHLKQGKAAEAERAYQQAIGESKGSQRTVGLWGKYAQALLSEGKVEEAQRILEQALNERKKEQAAPAQPSPPREKAQPALPGKLIITASKKLLDQAAGGKMSLDDFQKAATVEYVNLPTEPE
jgi:tetratricopeptide (TPR) repeat protein